RPDAARQAARLGRRLPVPARLLGALRPRGVPAQGDPRPQVLRTLRLRPRSGDRRPPRQAPTCRREETLGSALIRRHQRAWLATDPTLRLAPLGGERPPAVRPAGEGNGA